jgi:hypothetical protein
VAVAALQVRVARPAVDGAKLNNVGPRVSGGSADHRHVAFERDGTSEVRDFASSSDTIVNPRALVEVENVDGLRTGRADVSLPRRADHDPRSGHGHGRTENIAGHAIVGQKPLWFRRPASIRSGEDERSA